MGSSTSPNRARPAVAGTKVAHVSLDGRPTVLGLRAPRIPRPSGRGGGRGDRVGQDHPAAQDLPGARPGDGRDDRPHPAAAAGRPHGGRVDRRRAVHPARPAGRLPGPFHRPGRPRHPGQADDRRDPAGRAGPGPDPSPSAPPTRSRTSESCAPSRSSNRDQAGAKTGAGPGWDIMVPARLGADRW
jgi:hypothetical protein